ncbi:flowering time control protein-related [Actinidia rufa]|uniref:Flowering time control protein-related n=1 Tax=Actinidia rufa TaxID=165716 RepID=A0A7J0H8A8_9ERIC|nr:flowering time control protein-related [Actinidia rufa]
MLLGSFPCPGLHMREDIGYLDNWHTLLDPFLPPEAFGKTGDLAQQFDIFSQGITTQKFMPSTDVRIGDGQDIGTLLFNQCFHSDSKPRVKVELKRFYPQCVPKWSPGTGFKPQTVSNAPAPEIVVPSSTSSGIAVPKSARTADSLDCDWSEHTCPDGYMYYYNCVTCESRWEKPEEYFLFEQQLLPPPPQQQQQQQQQQQHSSCQQEERCLSNPLVFSAQEVSQT